MTSLKHILLTLFISTFTLNSFAQSNGKIMEFKTLKHDFGEIKETDGVASFRFEFNNKGKTPVVINHVQSSCGCTSPSWSREPVKPKSKGYIDVQFDPRNRPGTFHKTITIYTNTKDSPVQLSIRGKVIPKPRTIAQDYPFEMNGLRLKTNLANFLSIYHDEIKTTSIDVINTLDTELKLRAKENSFPNFIKIDFVPSTLKPKEKGIIKVTFNAIESNMWDFVNYRAQFIINDKQNGRNFINVSAIIKERFSDEIKKNPPIIKFTQGTDFDFGTIKQGEKVSHDFEFKNTGKSNLIIRKVRTSCGCTVGKLKDDIIKPGQTSKIQIVFNSAGRRGRQTKLVTLVTNCPDQSLNKMVLKISGNIAE